jgi:hypothetical protein
VTINCDQWRADYEAMDPAAQRAFHSQVYKEFPDQSHFSAAPLARAIEMYKPATVVEIGGWDGEAAVTMLERFSFLTRWRNYEVCAEAVVHGHSWPGYEAINPAGWYWDETHEADMFVGVHVIEHLRARDLEAAVRATTARVVYFEAPLLAGPTDWTGFSALHILEVGWAGVTDIMERHGYDLASREDLVLKPESGGFSRAYTYVMAT